jgi:hypothetical protein
VYLNALFLESKNSWRYVPILQFHMIEEDRSSRNITFFFRLGQVSFVLISDATI